MSLFHTCLVACLGVALCACETTGDPRQGGLFGWSREKAQARQAELRDQATSATTARDAEQAAVRTRLAEKGAAEQDLAQLERQVQAAEQETRRLEDELAQLAARNQAASRREHALLREVQSRRAQREAAARQGSPSGQGDAVSRRQHLQGAQDYNARLHAAILRMLAD